LVEKRTKRHGAEEIGRQVGESSCLAFFSDYLLCILFSSFFSPSFVTSFFSFPAGVPPHSHVTLFLLADILENKQKSSALLNLNIFKKIFISSQRVLSYWLTSWETKSRLLL
jgi:hypothetical protein